MTAGREKPRLELKADYQLLGQSLRPPHRELARAAPLGGGLALTRSSHERSPVVSPELFSQRSHSAFRGVISIYNRMRYMLRIFISSPGDVVPERDLASRVVERLQGEVAAAADLSVFRWEHEPIRATGSYQEQLLRPSEVEIVVCILWSKLGTRLPEGFEHREDGTPYESGTAFEFEDAERSYRGRGVPDLLVYRKTAEPLVSLREPAALRRAADQWDALEGYLRRWFRNEDGSSRAALTLFQTGDEFESLLEEHLRRLIRSRLEAFGALDSKDRAASATWLRGSPFRGLEVFHYDHAPIFFGRTRQISEIRDALVRLQFQGRPFLMVFGMSGCGKSSLVRAGVLPAITRPGAVEGVALWRWCAVRPSDLGSNLLAGLAGTLLSPTALPELESLQWTAPALADQLAAGAPVAGQPIQQALANLAAKEGYGSASACRLAVVIDQFEELFIVSGITGEERRLFVDALAALAESGLVWVIGTMRSDFYHRCAEIPALIQATEGEGQYHLQPPGMSEVGQIIRRPASAAGLSFEEHPTGERLDDVIQEATAESPASLPLLEFLLAELFTRRTGTGLLTFAAYQELGGLEGALATRAEAEYKRLPEAVAKSLGRVLRALVSSVGGDRTSATARPAALSSIDADPAARALVQAFVQARLLTTDRSETGETTIRVVHEALLAHWPRAKEMIDADREFLLWRQRLGAELATWQRTNKDEGSLLRGAVLAEAQGWLERLGSELTAGEREFIVSSAALQNRDRERVARRRRSVIAGLAAGLCIATALAGLALQQRRRAEQGRLVAESGSRALTALAHYDQGRSLEGLTAAIEAGAELRNIAKDDSPQNLPTPAPALALQVILDGMHARDRLEHSERDGAQAGQDHQSGSASSVECQIEIWPTSMVFKKGHKLRLDIQPRDGAGSAPYTHYHADYNAGATNTIYSGGDKPSWLMLPMIPPK